MWSFMIVYAMNVVPWLRIEDLPTRSRATAPAMRRRATFPQAVP